MLLYNENIGLYTEQNKYCLTLGGKKKTILEGNGLVDTLLEEALCGGMNRKNRSVNWNIRGV